MRHALLLIPWLAAVLLPVQAEICWGFTNESNWSNSGSVQAAI